MMYDLSFKYSITYVRSKYKKEFIKDKKEFVIY